MKVLDAIHQTARRAGGKYTRRRGPEAFERLRKDWRAAEKPERMLRRMEQLGLCEEARTLAQGLASGARVGFNPLERIIGQNQLMSSFFLRLGAERARAVGRIVTPTGVGIGTGFLISPRLLMTNNHVIEDERIAGRCRVEFDYVKRFDGGFGTTQLFSLLPGEFFLTSVTRDGVNLDYTIVAVEPINGRGQELVGRGFIPLVTTPGELTLTEWANIIQHPGGDPQQVALRDNKVVKSMEHFIHYEADTQPGSSGSPVFNDQWQLAALHHSGVPHEVRPGVYRLRGGGEWNTRQPLPYEEQLRMSANIKWLSNEGARIGSIIADVQARLGGGDVADDSLFKEAIRQQALPFLEGTGDSCRGGVGLLADAAPANGILTLTAPGTATWTVPLRITLEIGPDLGFRVSGGSAAPDLPQPAVTHGDSTPPQHPVAVRPAAAVGRSGPLACQSPPTAEPFQERVPNRPEIPQAACAERPGLGEMPDD